MATNPPPGWYTDPTGRYPARYWDGSVWTTSVNSGGANMVDAITATEASVPPAPGTEVATSPAQTPSVMVSTTTGRSGSGLGMIVGAVAVIIAAVIVFAVIANRNGDDSSPGDTTEAPATSEAPDESGGDGG